MNMMYRWSDYTAIWDKALAFKKEHGRLPNYIDYKIYRIMIDDLQAAAKNVTTFRKFHEGNNPLTVNIESSEIPGSNTKPPVRQSFTDWYNSMIGEGYAHYVNDKYTQQEEEYNLAHHIAMNCSDYSQTALRKAKELGYEARYIHVICQSGEGHIYIQVKGREFTDWEDADVAAAASVGSKYPLGKVWCSNPKAKWVSTESWLIINDGKEA
jgi:hypothetical protein